MGSILAGVALAGLGFRYSFVLFAALPLAAFAAVWFLPNENPIVRKEKIGAWKAIFSSGLFDLYLATALRQMAIFGTFALLVVYMKSIGIAVSVIGLIGASNTATQVLANLLFGWLADRIGRRRIFMLGFFLSAVTPLFFVLASNVYGMICGYVSLGLSFSSMYAGSTAFIGDRVPEERQGQMLGLYESSRGLGGLFGPVLAGILVPTIGYDGMFLVMSGIAAAGFLVLYIGRMRGGARAQAASS
jgi:MFS family permease